MFGHQISMFGHQTMFDGVWSPNISRLSRALGPGQTGNVWRPNTKHCLVTKHADFEVSGQTVKTRLIKHRSNNCYKPLSKHGTHARIKHVWYAAVQTNKTSPIKRENKRNVLSFFFDETQSNTIKQHQTRCPNGKMFGHQTMFDGVWSPNFSRLSRPLGHSLQHRHVWSPNNVWWCLVAKPFDSWMASSSIRPLPLSRKEELGEGWRKDVQIKRNYIW